MNDRGEQGFGSRAMRALTRLVVTLVVLAMGGVVVVLLSQLNSRTFTLALESGHLVVLKGRMLPWGALPYHPSDARLADTYAPIPLEGHEVPSSLLAQRFTEREELDHALFPLLEALARPRIAADEPQRVERGVYYLRRAERLGGLSEEQHATLKRLQAEVAYYQARQKLDDARKLITEAMAQLRLAAESDNRHSRNAHQMLTKVELPVDGLEKALREAVHTMSAPASREASQQPAPAAPAAPGAPAPDGETPARPPDLAAPGRTEGGTP